MLDRLQSWLGGGKAISKLFVVFNNRRLGVTFGDEDYDGKDIKLGSLRLKLAEQLGVPADELQLYQVEPRRKLTSDGAGLLSFGINNNDELLAVHKPKPKPQGPKEQITSLVQDIDIKLGERMRKFCAAPPQDKEQRETEYRILTEVILAAMIKLDDVDAAGDPEIRASRKEAINKLNVYNKDIDDANSQPFQNQPKKDSDNINPGQAGSQTEQNNKKGKSRRGRGNNKGHRGGGHGGGHRGGNGSQHSSRKHTPK